MNQEKLKSHAQLSFHKPLALLNMVLLERGLSYCEAYKMLRLCVNLSSNKEGYPKNIEHKLVIICDQNQGRSQIEEKILQWLLNEMGVRATIVSAGIRARPEKYHSKPGPIVTAAIESMGISMQEAAVTQLQEDHIDPNIILVALCDEGHIPEYAFRARTVICTHIPDLFPESEAPPTIDSLKPIVEECAWLAFQIAVTLAEATKRSDFSIFTNYFKKVILDYSKQASLPAQS